jgi:hypothetical protein
MQGTLQEFDDTAGSSISVYGTLDAITPNLTAGYNVSVNANSTVDNLTIGVGKDISGRDQLISTNTNLTAANSLGLHSVSDIANLNANAYFHT